MENKTDEDVVKLSLKEKEAYSELVKKYQNKLFYYVLRISSLTKEDAQDIVQTTFIKAYRNLNNFDQSLKFSSWIYRICHNETRNVFKKNKNIISNIVKDDLDLFDIIASKLDTELEINKEYEASLIRKELKNLKPIYKEVLILYYFENKQYKEISDILKKPINTVSVLILRAKKELRNKLKNYGY